MLILPFYRLPLVLYQNPVTDHFPTNTIKLTLSGDVPTVRLSKFLPTLPETHSIAVFVGAMARGSVFVLVLLALGFGHRVITTDD